MPDASVLRVVRLDALGRFVALVALALGVFAAVLLVFGRNPLRAYADIFSSTLGSTYGFSETLVKMIPLMLTALAAAVPSRIWLINVGGEGQLFVGALCATWAAIHLAALPSFLLLGIMAVFGFLGGCGPGSQACSAPAAS